MLCLLDLTIRTFCENKIKFRMFPALSVPRMTTLNGVQKNNKQHFFFLYVQCGCPCTWESIPEVTGSWRELKSLKGTGGCRTVSCLLGPNFECIFLFKMPLSHTKCYRNCKRNELKVEAIFHHLLFEKIDEYSKTIWQEAEDYGPTSSPRGKAAFLQMGSKHQDP